MKLCLRKDTCLGSGHSQMEASQPMGKMMITIVRDNKGAENDI